jgi:hypothetical protein
VSWGAPEAIVERAPWRYVLASDVLYEQRNGPQLLARLPAAVAEGGEAWIADPGRAAAPAFFDAARRAGWAVDAVGHPGPATVTVHRLRRASAPPG